MDERVSGSVSSGPTDADLRRVYDRLDMHTGTINEVQAKQETHEAVCAIRYQRIDDHLWWMRWLMIVLVAASLLEPRQLIAAALKQWGVEVSVSNLPKPPPKAP